MVNISLVYLEEFLVGKLIGFLSLSKILSIYISKVGTGTNEVVTKAVFSFLFMVLGDEFTY